MSESYETNKAPRTDPLAGGLTSLIVRLVGGTSAACMDNEMTARNAGLFIHSLEKHIFQGRDLRASVRTIISSLLLPFVVRMSTSTDWITRKNQGRICRCMCAIADRLNTLPESAEQSYVKYWLDRSLAKAFRDANPYPPPKEEFAQPLFSGYLLTYLNRRLARRDRSFLYSLQKGAKLAWPKLCFDLETQALKKHRDAICRTPSPIEDEEMCQTIRSVSFEVLTKVDRELLKKFLPSGSACLEFRKAHGGTGSLFKPLDLNPKHTETDILTLRKFGLDPERSFLGRLRDLQVTVDFHRLQEFRRLEGELLRQFPSLRVDVVSIPEPGKFRIISKGCGELYTYLQPLQGAMLGCWKKHPASTMLHDDLTERVQNLADWRPCSFKLWASVDYSAATDNLKRHVSMLALEGLRDPELREIGQSSFCRGPICYPKRINKLSGEVIEKDIDYQGEGQLMGHPLSFPLLCIANLACYRRAITRWCDHILADWDSPAQLRRDAENLWNSSFSSNRWTDGFNLVIVNGDDMLFPCDELLYKFFTEETTKVGFIFSPGKNYLSPDTAMINSQLFSIEKGRVRKLSYLNQRLILGHCLKNETSKALPIQISGAMNRMLELAPWTRSVVPLILSRWRKKRRDVFSSNWYLPVHLGGYGVDVRFAPQGWYVSRLQRRIAARFLREPKLSLFRTLGARMPSKVLLDLCPPVVFSNNFSEEQYERDRWLERIMYAHRWSLMGDADLNDDERSYLPRRIDAIRNLKPMSDAGLVEYWRRYPQSNFRNACPDLQPLSYSLSFKRKQGEFLNSLQFEGVFKRGLVQ